MGSGVQVGSIEMLEACCSFEVTSERLEDEDWVLNDLLPAAKGAPFAAGMVTVILQRHRNGAWMQCDLLTRSGICMSCD